jgi:hypothetical protein
MLGVGHDVRLRYVNLWMDDFRDLRESFELGNEAGVRVESAEQ